MDETRRLKIAENREMVEYLDNDPQARDVLTALRDRKRCQKESLGVVAPGRVDEILKWMMQHMLATTSGSFVVITEKGSDLYDKIRPKKQRRKDETGTLFPTEGK